MTMPDMLILASASPYKRALLARLPVKFDIIDADIDESAQPDESPELLARRLARAKAQEVARQNRGAYVLGGDQVIALGDQRFSKPNTTARAVEQLLTLQGKTHRLITAVCLVPPKGPPKQDQVIFEMVMRPLNRAQIEAYVAEDTPLDCAGSYRIEAAGIRLFEATRGDDPTAIEGLPLTRVWSMLIDAGWPQ